MAHLYIPLDGVPIVPAPPGPDFIAADGYVVFALSVVSSMRTTKPLLFGNLQAAVSLLPTLTAST